MIQFEYLMMQIGGKVMKKQTFENPVAEIVILDSTDIITTSNDGWTGDYIIPKND